jgi:CubicO group peptidase (beta-lactamase class C family)
MIRALLLALLLGGCVTASAPGAIRTLNGHTLTPASIDARVTQLMAANDVKGLAVGFIRNGQVVYVHAYGMRDVENQLPLQTDTVMYGASLTKATFAYMVMQLVDEHKLDLDRPLAEYLPKPLPEYDYYASLASDPRWRTITARMALDHTTGFANFAFLEPDQKLHMHWDPGTHFGYSGDGIQLLQFVLEEGLHLDVGAEMQRRVFDRFGMTRTSMTWREGFRGNLTHGYELDGKMELHDMRSRVRAAGSMDTTIADWSNFLAGVSRGDGLSPAAWTDMTSRHVVIDTEAQFPTLTQPPHDWSNIRLGYGVGWGVFETPYGHAFFKEGHDDGTANYGICIAARRDCLVLMSNSVRAEGIFLYLVNDLLGPTNLPASWELYTPYDRQQPATH